MNSKIIALILILSILKLTSAGLLAEQERIFLKIHKKNNENFDFIQSFQKLIQSHLGPQYDCLKQKGQPCQDQMNAELQKLPKAQRQERALRAVKELLKLNDFLKENKRATGADISNFLKTSGILQGENKEYWTCMAQVFIQCDGVQIEISENVDFNDLFKTHFDATHLGPQYDCLKKKGQPCQDQMNAELQKLPKVQRQERAIRAVKELLKLNDFLQENQKATGADIEQFLRTSGILQGENQEYWTCMAQVFVECDNVKIEVSEEFSDFNELFQTHFMSSHLGPQYDCLKQKGQPCQDQMNAELQKLPKPERQERAIKAVKQLLKLNDFLQENQRATGADIQKFLQSSGILDGENQEYWTCMAKVFVECDGVKLI